MKVIFASDEKTVLTDAIERWLKEHGHRVMLMGHLTDEKQKWFWAEIGRRAAEVVASGDAERGILCCWSGTGIAMAANRVQRARAALCWDAETARLARKWDNANILAMSLRATSETVAWEILDAFFATKFDEEDLNQVAKLDR